MDRVVRDFERRTFARRECASKPIAYAGTFRHCQATTKKGGACVRHAWRRMPDGRVFCAQHASIAERECGKGSIDG